MENTKHLAYIESLLERFLSGFINGEELDILFNYYCNKYFDYKTLNNEALTVVEDLIESLAFYEHNSEIRKEHQSYFGEEKLKEIIFNIHAKFKQLVE